MALDLATVETFTLTGNPSSALASGGGPTSTGRTDKALIEHQETTMTDHAQHSATGHATHGGGGHKGHGRPYLMFWINMILGLAVMYVVMFSMIDGWPDFRNNMNMFYMAVTMWAPMGIFMLATMPGMFPNRKMNIVLYIAFALLTVLSFGGTRSQAFIDDRQFVDSMIPHHSGAILMCREADLEDQELRDLCQEIIQAQRSEIQQMEAIAARL